MRWLALPGAMPYRSVEAFDGMDFTPRRFGEMRSWLGLGTGVRGGCVEAWDGELAGHLGWEIVCTSEFLGNNGCRHGDLSFGGEGWVARRRAECGGGVCLSVPGGAVWTG